MTFFVAISFLAVLSAADLERLVKYDNVRLQRTPEAIEEARREFAGRGRDVAEHFLRHGDYPPSGGAYAFVLQALGDVEATIILIRALPEPPKLESGVTAKYGMGRDEGEINYVIEAVLENDHVKTDPRVISAVVDAVAVAKARPKGIGLGAAGRAVSLLGKCRGPGAIRALQDFAKDPESSIRSLAIQALGQMDVTPEEAGKMQTVTIETLARTLQSDVEADARLQAATSLANLGSAEGIEPLQSALNVEKNPRVVDAIVTALERLNAPVVDPEACRRIVERCWEPALCFPLFERWRASAAREAVIGAATTGPPTLRALALYSLVRVSAPPREQFLVPLKVPAPPIDRPAPGSRIIANRPIPVESPTPPVELDLATRDRLLISTVEVLSHAVSFFPKAGAISHGTAQITRDALWEIAGRQVSVALRYTDRIEPPYGRYTSTGRYAASHDLYSKDPAGYLAYRRPRQFLAALLIALPFTIFLLHRWTRRSAVLLTVGILGWGTWSLFMKVVRELPPPPLHFLTIACIAFLAAGSVSALLVFLSRMGTRFSWLRDGLGRGGLAVVGAGGLAFAVCAWSRWNHLFPIGGEGWELIFDPLGSAILAVGAATLLSLLDMLIHRVLG
ncbi:MAG: HEAT repeat domain-containing protein [Candidatus Methylomirabilales bacterium]